LERFPTASGDDGRPRYRVRIGAATSGPQQGHDEQPCLPDPTRSSLLAIEAPFFEGSIDLDRMEAALRPRNPHEEPSGVERRVYGLLRLLACVHTAHRGGLALHAACMSRGDRAFVFMGRRRAGKTTLVRLFQGDTVLGDDLALIEPVGDGYVAWGTPFSGRERTAASLGRSPVGGVLLLRQGPTTVAEPLGRAEAAAALWRHAFVHEMGEAARSRTMEAVLRAASALPCHRLSVSLSTSPWTLEALR
jgi:hypothetical protein